MKKISILFLAGFLGAGAVLLSLSCSVSPSGPGFGGAVETLVVGNPTLTPTPTFTPTETRTMTVTPTPTVTETPTVTPTPV